MIHFYFALPHVTLEMQCVVLLVPCIYSPCRWTSQCKKRRNTLMCLVGSTTFSITLVSDSICPMSSLSRTDVGEVYSRLLDHRPVIQGEIRYFVKEFEEKRGLRELRVLENLKNTIFETNERVLPKCEQAMQDNLSETFKRLQAANAMMHRLQEREYEARKLQADKVMAREEKCIADCEEFMKEQQNKRAEVDEEHRKAMERLKEQYSEMEKELAKYVSF
uniref:Biogenesis of lysosome-related organelles complex 1 subunit 5 n=2 Tax=Muscicapidae TaxID=36291 RepID=A0A803WBS8_FICAL